MTNSTENRPASKGDNPRVIYRKEKSKNKKTQPTSIDGYTPYFACRPPMTRHSIRF